MNRHHAGRDLSSEFPAAPHDEEVFERYPQVAVIAKKTKSQRLMPAFVSSLVDRFPFLERHPHPLTVHFPIVSFCPLLLQYFVSVYRYRIFRNHRFSLLNRRILFLPVGMVTGFFTWWLNYLAKPMKPVVWKIVALRRACRFFVRVFFSGRIAAPGILNTSGRHVWYTC